MLAAGNQPEFSAWQVTETKEKESKSLARIGGKVVERKVWKASWGKFYKKDK